MRVMILKPRMMSPRDAARMAGVEPGRVSRQKREHAPLPGALRSVRTIAALYAMSLGEDARRLLNEMRRGASAVDYLNSPRCVAAFCANSWEA